MPAVPCPQCIALSGVEPIEKGDDDIALPFVPDCSMCGGEGVIPLAKIWSEPHGVIIIYHNAIHYEFVRGPSEG